MEIVILKEKLAKEEADLKKLNEQKEKVEKKVSIKQKKIQDYKNLIDRQQFSELTDVLSSSGLSRDEIIEAIKNKDLLTIQEKLEKENKNTANG